MIADVNKIIALIQQISAGRSMRMAEKTYSVSEAMTQLRSSLAGLGLEHTGIAIACCGGSREKSSLIAQKLVAGGFGRAVKPSDRSVRYETRDGWFSWDTVADGEDMINLFYSLGADDEPVDYLIGEAAESPGPSRHCAGDGRRETAPGKGPEDFQENVPGDRAGVGGLQTGRAGMRENHPENRPVHRRDKAAPGWRWGGAGSDEQGPEETPVAGEAEAAPGGRGGGGHSLYPAAAGPGSDQTGQQAGSGGNSRVTVRRRLF